MNPVTRKRLRASALAAVAAISVGLSLPAVADNEASVNDLLQRGNEEMDAGKLDAASAYFEEAIKSDPSSPEAHNQLGLCYSRRNMLLEAAGEFRAALDINPQFLPSLNNLGSVEYRHGNYDEAIKFYKKALALKEGDEEIQVNLASVYRDKATYLKGPTRNEDYRQAVSLYQRALATSPNFAPAHNNLGLCYLRLHRYGEAEGEVKRAIEIKNDYAAAYFNLGLIEEAQHKLPEAISAFQNSLRYETVPQYKESTRQRIQSLGLPPDDTDHFSRGFDLLSQRKWSAAEEEFRQAISAGGARNAVAWNNLGYSLSRQQKNKQACDAYVKAIAVLPTFAAAHYNYGQALVAMQDLSGAQREFKKAIDLTHGRYPLAHNALGIVLKQQGQQKAALSQYRLALMQSGDTLPVIHYNLGLLHEQLGEKDQARAEYQQYLTMSPTGINAPGAQKRLDALTK